MAVAFGNLQKLFSKTAGIIFGVVFILASFWSYKVENSFLSFGLGFIACAAVFMMMYGSKEVKCLNWFAKYTMPIFLMHTLFAAPCRVVLLKLGFYSAIMQVSVGIAASFVGPIVATIIMKKLKPLDFMVFPGKYIRLK